MPDCTPTGNRRWTGHWEYVGAAPFNVRGSAGPSVAVASAAYVYRRKFEMEYVCCPGDDEAFVWVDNNYAYYIERDYDSAFTVYHFGVQPVGGVLGALIDAAGGEITIADWWTDPKDADGGKPGVDDSQGPNIAHEKIQPAPKAICGQRITLPGGETIPWPPKPPKPPPTSDDPPPWHPRAKWPPEMANCCTGISPTPVLTVVSPPVPHIYLDGGSWFVDVKLNVSHPCGLKTSPIVTEFLIHDGHPHLHPQQRAKITPSADGKGYDIEWKREQVAARSQFGAGFKAFIHAVSKCEGELDATYTLHAEYQPGERVPNGASGRWQCSANKQVVQLSGGEKLPACGGRWIWLGP